MQTGTTEMKLVGTREPPTFGMAMFGAVAQLCTLSYVWWHDQPEAQACMRHPISCLLDPKTADPFGRQVSGARDIISIYPTLPRACAACFYAGAVSGPVGLLGDQQVRVGH